MSDLFQHAKTPDAYSAKDIEVLEGLEPVRRRPGMYIGGTDERALHHLAAEVLDNAMDEAVAGHANRIEMGIGADGSLTISDNGRGIPIDPHPKYPDKSALEVILTMLHSGGKFGGSAYKTSGGLHGVGISVVNALSEHLEVEVARDRRLWRQTYSRGHATSAILDAGAVQNRRGTTVTFRPDPEIFTAALQFKPWRLYRMARSKAYLFRGVEIRWSCDPSRIAAGDETPTTDSFHFPGGLADFLAASLGDDKGITPTPFAGRIDLAGDAGEVEWAIAWPVDGEAFVHSYCNTIPTPEGGTHEAGLRAALARSLKAYGELVGNKRAQQITGDDAISSAAALLSLFIREPQFQGQTKEKLASAEATRLVEAAIRFEVVFLLFVKGQQIVPSPAGEAEITPAVVILCLAAHVNHRIDGRTATEHFPARIGDGSTAQTCFGHGFEHPIGPRIADSEQIANRNVEPNPVVIAASFKQQDTVAWIGRQAIGKDASGRARAHDDIVELVAVE